MKELLKLMDTDAFWVAIDVETKELVAIYVSSLGAL
jgi:hypothetical protein